MKSCGSVCGTRLYELPALAPDEQVLLLSDLHLGPGTEHAIAMLGTALAWARRNSVRRVLILGDLFDFWVGTRQARVPGFDRVVRLLQEAVESGLELWVFWGNRDYALDQSFVGLTGVRLVPGGAVLPAGPSRLLLLHGDELCWNDVPYQRSKRWLRAGATVWLLHHLPLAASLRLAGKARTRSRMANPHPDPERWWPVAEAMAELAMGDFTHVVFGHIHRPASGQFDAPGRPPLHYRILPAFDETGVCIRVTADVLEHFDPATGAAVAYGTLAFPRLRTREPRVTAGADGSSAQR